MEASTENERSIVDVSTYSGTGLAYAVASASTRDEVLGVVLSSARVSQQVLRRLLFFDRCYLVVSDFSELLGLWLLLGDELDRLLWSRHLQLIRLPAWPAYLRLGIDERIDAVGPFVPGHVGPVSPDGIAEISLTGDLFDKTLETLPVETSIRNAMTVLRPAVINTTMQKHVSYSQVGIATFNDMLTFVNLHRTLPNTLTTPMAVNSLFSEYLKRKSSESIFPSYLNYSQRGEELENIVSRQFLFNLGLELARELKASDYEAADDHCPMMKTGTFWKAAMNEDERRRGAESTSIFRFMKLSGMPDPLIRVAAKSSTASTFVDLVLSPNAKAFRKWFHANASADPDSVVQAYINLLSETAPHNTAPARILRYLVSGGAGLLPGIGTAAGLTLSAIDTFFFDSIVSDRKIKVFIHDVKAGLSK